MDADVLHLALLNRSNVDQILAELTHLAALTTAPTRDDHVLIHAQLFAIDGDFLYPQLTAFLEVDRAVQAPDGTPMFYVTGRLLPLTRCETELQTELQRLTWTTGTIDVAVNPFSDQPDEVKVTGTITQHADQTATDQYYNLYASTLR